MRKSNSTKIILFFQPDTPGLLLLSFFFLHFIVCLLDHHDRGHQRRDSRTAAKISLCRSHWPSPIIYPSWEPWRQPPYHHIVSSFENTFRATHKNKRHRRRNHSTIPSSPDQPFSCSCCDRIFQLPACFAVGVDCYLHDFRLQSQAMIWYNLFYFFL